MRKNSVLKKIVQLGCLTLGLIPPILSFHPDKAAAGTSVYEDQLTTTSGLSWGAPKLPYNQAADIKDSLVETSILGKIVPDRHGIKSEGIQMYGPFKSPQFGKFVFVSLWGSKIEGCFVEMVIQYAPKNGLDVKNIAPVLFEIGVGDQTIALKPKKGYHKAFTQDYSYQVQQNGGTYNVNSTWFMTRNIFKIDSHVASLLSDAPIKEVNTRLTLSDGETIILPIGQGTVKQWKEVYSFNPKCINLNQPENPVKPPTKTGAKKKKQ